jgi:pyridoxamine 5'-phosphate oxidase
MEWLGAAISAEIPEPRAMTLSTIDEHGFPDARVLLLKESDADGWHFAMSAASPKDASLQSYRT